MSRVARTAAVCWMLAATRVQAQELPLELVWNAPEQCPSGAEVRAELERVVRVQRRVGLAPLVARVQVARSGAGFVAHVTTEHEGRFGQRTLSANDCAVMVRSVSLVLGLAFGEGVEVVDEASSPPSPPANAPSPPLPAATATTSPSASTSPSTTVAPDVGVWIAGGVGFALLPSPSFAGEVGVEVQFAAVSLGVRGFGWPGVHEESEDVRTGYAAYGGGARGCGLLPLDSLVWTGCAGFSAAAVRGAAESSEAIRSDSATAPWYSVSAAVGVDWPRDSRIRLRATGELSVSLNRPRFRIEGGETTHRVSALVPLLAAGVLLVL